MRELIPFEKIDTLALHYDLQKLNEFFYSFMYLDSTGSPF